ncbi:MAG: translation initiation factor IF-3 [Alphaproteobacteria bacterium]|nr:translation initiation factor IF-3 [Alphaproteobacteria bacterium]
MEGSNSNNRTSTEKYRINRAITAQQVRLIDHNGESAGVVGIRTALAKAEEVGLDLVEVSPNAVPPVCKIIDYGKLKYELQKKKAEAKKKQKVIEVKEVKFTPVIGEHDYQVKLNSILKFTKEGNKVKVTLKFRGRELSRQEIGVKLLNRLIDDVKDVAKNESKPQLEGRQMMMILTPLIQK